MNLSSPDQGYRRAPNSVRGRSATVADAHTNEALIAICGDMFAAGMDTRDMSIRLVIPEAACLAALHVARERQRRTVQS